MRRELCARCLGWCMDYHALRVIVVFVSAHATQTSIGKPRIRPSRRAEEKNRTAGFFGINMASTGTGKTLANGRILYALADPHLGARFTLALGLRTLTLQTGNTYRDRLALDSEDLAVLVGGGAIRELHERARPKVPGSDSSEDLLPEQTHVKFEESLENGPLKEWLSRQPNALLNAPIVVCTIDHLMPATESTRGGRQILPMLRFADLLIWYWTK